MPRPSRCLSSSPPDSFPAVTGRAPPTSYRQLRAPPRLPRRAVMWRSSSPTHAPRPLARSLTACMWRAVHGLRRARAQAFTTGSTASGYRARERLSAIPVRVPRPGFKLGGVEAREDCYPAGALIGETRCGFNADAGWMAKNSTARRSRLWQRARRAAVRKAAVARRVARGRRAGPPRPAIRQGADETTHHRRSRRCSARHRCR